MKIYDFSGAKPMHGNIITIHAPNTFSELGVTFQNVSATYLGFKILGYLNGVSMNIRNKVAWLFGNNGRNFEFDDISDWW